MKPVSLKLKLFSVSALAILIALAIAGFAIAALFSTHVKSNMIRDLSDQFDRLVVLLDPQIPVPTLSSPLANPSFSVPYGGLYWQITNIKTLDRTRSRSMWDAEFPTQATSVLDGRQHTINLIDPEGTPAIAIIQRLQLALPDASFRTFDFIIAEDINRLEAANSEFQDGLFQSLFVLSIALALAAWVQISFGLAPLRRIKSEINKIRNGAAKSMNTNHSPEVMPLIEEVNGLLQTQEQTISFARTRASNLAHALKTQLSILQSEAEKLHQAGSQHNAEQIEQLGQDMHNIIDHQLRLSRLRTRSSGDYFASPLLASISKVVDALKRTPEARTVKTIEWKISVPEKILVNIDSPDLFELLGIILENAVKWTDSQIAISASIVQDKVILSILDDGPGLSPQRIESLGQRSARIDQSSTGSGIGLSIAKEIVTMNRGEIGFSSNEPAGLKVTISLPASTHS